ncbi:hypothetical protein K1T71_014235 [Dendrolimus kikuchii]|uniref:Uncharacterized protein n=1 Tax=Dendrolimus kikuchii TaxID=765133 RepID=A0ACC1CFN6_9NEOP|nr:hypothetical protein K1T71_014235 [Dendrolimus kikuchii]
MELCLKSLFFVFWMAVASGQTLGGPMHGKAVVCYVASWATYRLNAGQFNLENLEPSLCTHIVYSFAGLDDKTNIIKSLDPWQDLEKDYGKRGYKRIVALKEQYPHLKVTIAIGGWNEGSPKYSKMASDPELRQTFIKSVMVFLDNYKFDGLDLDWEYPTKRGGLPEDRTNFISLVKELKEAFEPKGYILTAALGAGKTTMDTAYDLAKLSRYLDLLHMMCYDYHGTWDGVVGANAPLRGLDSEDFLSVEYTIKYMLDHGVSPYKLVLGLPMYGRTFILTNPDEKRIQFGRTAVHSTGFRGPFTGEDGFFGYNEICLEITNATSKWTHHWHRQSSTPYLRDGDRVISYDNPRSIAMKVRMAIQYNLGGLMVWSIDTDDFQGVCHNETNTYVDFEERYHEIANDPLLKKALKTLNLPDETRSLRKGSSYVISDGNLKFRPPPAQYTNFGLMQTINQAASLALEEKRILDEMEMITRENEIPEEVPKGTAVRLASMITVVFGLLLMVF